MALARQLPHRSTTGRPTGLAVALSFVALVIPAALPGQTPDPPGAGARVRIFMPGFHPPFLTGRLVAFDRREVTVWGDSAHPSVTLPARLLQRFEVSRGRNPAVILGLPAALAATGVLVAPRVMPERRECPFTPEDPACVKQTPDEAVGAAVGLVVGLFLGPLLARERWRDIPVAILIGGRNRGPLQVGLGVAVRF